jgi:hypothetical protein
MGIARVDGNAARVAGASTGSASDQGKATRGGASEWSRGDASDIDGQNPPEAGQNGRKHESAWAASEFQPPVVDYANDGRSEALRHDVTKKILLIGGICFALAIDAVGVAATAALPTR